MDPAVTSATLIVQLSDLQSEVWAHEVVAGPRGGNTDHDLSPGYWFFITAWLVANITMSASDGKSQVFAAARLTSLILDNVHMCAVM